ncbi:MAG: hypothetical protein ACLGHP_02630, partial [Vicinamibacteria bacterium]
MRISHRPPIAVSPLAALVALLVAGCGGSSDSTDGSAGAASGGATKLSLVAYAVPKVGFDAVIPLFQRTAAGRDVAFSESYGASGDQSRAVVAGLEAKGHRVERVRPPVGSNPTVLRIDPASGR